MTTGTHPPKYHQFAQHHPPPAATRPRHSDKKRPRNHAFVPASAKKHNPHRKDPLAPSAYRASLRKLHLSAGGNHGRPLRHNKHITFAGVLSVAHNNSS